MTNVAQFFHNRQVVIINNIRKNIITVGIWFGLVWVGFFTTFKWFLNNTKINVHGLLAKNLSHLSSLADIEDTGTVNTSLLISVFQLCFLFVSLASLLLVIKSISYDNIGHFPTKNRRDEGNNFWSLLTLERERLFS